MIDDEGHELKFKEKIINFLSDIGLYPLNGNNIFSICVVILFLIVCFMFSAAIYIEKKNTKFI